MRRLTKLSTVAMMIWLVTLYGYALVVSSNHERGDSAKILTDSQNNEGYWSPNPALLKSEGGWDERVWKWHEFLGCGSSKIMDSDPYNYARWSSANTVEIGMLTPPELDRVYVSGISAGSVWDDVEPVYQPQPLDVSEVGSMILETKVTEWKGAPLSPVIFPSWYALLTDVWFNVTDVVIKKEGRTEQFESKILGIDIFYHTMTGSLNAVMGAGNEFSRIEPCNENLVYSINLSGQDLYSVNDDGFFVIDLLAVLQRAQQNAAEQGWLFSIDDAELVMLETVVESYWSYAYAKVTWNGIRYCTYAQEECAIE